jgi:hypothetical protein
MKNSPFSYFSPMILAALVKSSSILRGSSPASSLFLVSSRAFASSKFTMAFTNSSERRIFTPGLSVVTVNI